MTLKRKTALLVAILPISLALCGEVTVYYNYLDCLYSCSVLDMIKTVTTTTTTTTITITTFN